MILAAAFALALSAADGPAPIEYEVAPVMGAEGAEALAVTLRLTGDADGETRLRLPDRWAGETELHRHLDALTVEGATVEAPSPAVRVLKHAPGAPLTVRYRVRHAYDGDLAVDRPESGNPYRPVIRPGHVSVLGHAAMIVPERDDYEPVRFRFGALPEGWTAASDMEHPELRLRGVRESLIVAGRDARVIALSEPGEAPARAILAAPFAFDTEAFARDLRAVMRAQRDYFGAEAAPYLVGVTPLVPSTQGRFSIGGTGLEDGFMVYAATDTDGAALARMRVLLAHEHAHTWSPRALGPMPEAREAESYWFSEGFTDFVTHRSLLRAGLWRAEDFAEAFNETLRDHGLSPVRTAPNSAIGEKFWTDEAHQKLPYRRGYLIAWALEARLRERTRGRRDMDDVLADQIDRAERAQRAKPMPPYATEQFVRAYRGVGGEDPRPFLAAHVERGEAFDLPADLFGTCGAIETIRRPTFDRGFDSAATNASGGVIAGVKPDGAAYRAGLRDGMRFVRREAGVPGDSSQEYVFRVMDGETERVIRWFPAGEGEESFQRLTLTDLSDPAERRRCTAVLAGM